MSTPVFYTPLDAVSTTLTSAHASGSGTLVVASASAFGSPSVDNPIRVTVTRLSDGARCHFKVTAVSGNTLTVTTIDGYSDTNFAIGDTVGVYISSNTLKDIHQAISTLYNVRVVWASTIATLDCDLNTGLTAGGGTPTDNAAAINSVLATATESSPVHLIIDGGAAIGSPILIPPTGHVAITGKGWDTGFHILPGSTCNGIQNFPHTDYANNYAWSGGSGYATDSSHIYTGVSGKNVFLSNFRINGSRGTYPNGNSNGHRDGTITDSGLNATTATVQGNYPTVYWLTTITLAHIDNLVIDNVFAYDSPTYHINIFDCSRYNIQRCRLDATDPVNQVSTDGIHINGGCIEGFVTDIVGAVGDDLIAVNIAEGNASSGGDLVISGIHGINCMSGVRIYGSETSTRRIFISNIVMEGCFGQGILIGDGNPSHSITDTNLSIWIDGIDIDFDPNAVSYAAGVRIGDHVGHLHMQRVAMISPRKAIPLVTLESGCKVSSFVMKDCHIHRNTSGNTAAYAFLGSSGCGVNLMDVDGFRVTDTYGTSNTDIPTLFNFAGTTVNILSFDGILIGVATVLNFPSDAVIGKVIVKNLVHSSHAVGATAYSIVSSTPSMIPVSIVNYSSNNVAGIANSSVNLIGPGLVSSGFSFPDSITGNGSIYNSSTRSGLVYKDNSGTVNVISVTPILVTGALHAALFNLSANSGNGQPIGAPSTALFQGGAGAFTVGCFAKLSSKAFNIQAFMSKFGSNPEWMLFYANGPDAFSFITQDSLSTSYEADGTIHPSIGTWYFVVGVHDPANSLNRVYVNGGQDGSIACSAATRANTDPFWIGGAQSNPSSWSVDGDVAMVFKYSAALTGTQITWLYNSGNGRSTSEILAETGLSTPDFLYSFDNSNNLGLDSGPNNLSLTNVNATGPVQATGPA